MYFPNQDHQHVLARLCGVDQLLYERSSNARQDLLDRDHIRVLRGPGQQGRTSVTDHVAGWSWARKAFMSRTGDGYRGFISSSVSSRICVTAQSRNHFSFAGTTYQGTFGEQRVMASS